MWVTIRHVQDAVKLEEYSKAAELRDKIQELEDADPILQLEGKLKAAIERQDFQAKSLKKAYKFTVQRKCAAFKT